MTAIQRSSVPRFDQLGNADLLASIHALGLDGCLFASPLEISAKLDRSEMRGTAAMARQLGISLGSSLGRINLYRPEASAPLSAMGGGDLLAGVTRTVAACADIGITSLFFMAGIIEDRFNRSVAWADQLDALSRFLARLAPVLRDHKMRLLLKTHEEITTFEVARLVETIGPEILGVALDPVNLFVRIEDPVAATARIAPYVAHVHLDDAAVCFADGGLRRVLCPLGQGQIDWPAILAMVGGAKRVVELHRGQFSMPIFQPDWLAAQPDLTVAELAAVVGLAASARNLAMPWDQNDALSRLQPTLAHLKKLPA